MRRILAALAMVAMLVSSAIPVVAHEGDPGHPAHRVGDGVDDTPLEMEQAFERIDDEQHGAPDGHLPGSSLNVDLVGVDTADAWVAASTLFSESASRVVVSVAPGRAAAFQQRAKDFGVPARDIGTTGTARVRVLISGRSVIDIGVDEAEAIWDTALGKHFTQRAA